MCRAWGQILIIPFVMACAPRYTSAPLRFISLCMEYYLPQFISTLVLVGIGAAIGLPPVRKIIAVREAKHELREGSASFLRGIGGWSIIAFWIAALWFGGTIIGDWGATGDLEGAIDRSWLRLRILLEILAALADE